MICMFFVVNAFTPCGILRNKSISMTQMYLFIVLEVNECIKWVCVYYIGVCLSVIHVCLCIDYKLSENQDIALSRQSDKWYLTNASFGSMDLGSLGAYVICDGHSGGGSFNWSSSSYKIIFYFQIGHSWWWSFLWSFFTCLMAIFFP